MKKKYLNNWQITFHRNSESIIFACCLFLITNIASYSQDLNLPNVKTPTANAMETFGNIPVSLATGTPDISIPLHTLQKGNISVPISLRYHPGTASPITQPGWVGMGWNLQSVGVITRNVNTFPDESRVDGYDVPGGMTTATKKYYNENNPSQSGSNLIENSSDWFSLQNLNRTVEPTDYDVAADEFNFNFLNYSGKFQYAGPTKGWVVISDDNIKIEQVGFLTPNEIRQDLQPYINSEGSTNGAVEPFFNSTGLIQIRAFKNFVLTTPDGTRYTFGGAGAVEYSTSFYSTVNTSQVSLNSWYLKKIEDIYGNVVDFVYNKDYITCDLQDGVLVNGFEVTKITQTGSLPALTRTSSTYFNTQSGSFIFPIYLSSIASENELVTFNSAIANTLKYTEQQLKSGGQSNINLYVIGSDLNNLKTKKLVSLSVLDKINNKTVKTASFYYNEGSAIRFSLNSLTINNSEKYSFNYAGEGIPQPPFLLKTEDFWNDAYGTAYLNPLLANGSTHFTAAFPQFLILKKITYPTKGYTEFLWEGHKYGRKVSPARNSLAYETGYVEGSRISEIRSYNDNNELLTKKSYLYVKNYNNLTTNTDYLLSSGNSEGSPKIIKSYYSAIGTNNYLVKAIHTPYRAMFNLAANGLRVGYDEVVEKNADNSYTKHHFTSYDSDITGHSHFDQAPAGYRVLTLPGFTEYYYPYSNLELERGKPVGVFDYNSANKLVKQTITNYRDDFPRFSSFYKQIKRASTSVYNPANDANSTIDCFVALKLFNYNYYPVRQETTVYDINGGNPIITSEEFSYNSINQLSVKSTTIPNSLEKNYFKYFYPTDVPNEPLMASLIQANRLNSSVLEEVHEGATKIRATKTTFVNTAISSGTIPMPSNLYSAKFPNSYPVIPNVGQMESKMTYNKYDDKGNLLQYTSENGLSTVFLWGYKKMYPIAKIENAAYANVQQYEANLQTISNTANSEDSLLSALQSLRTSLPDSMVTTYTYNPLIGISTVTSPNGETIKYKYDVLNKLQSILDKDNQILQYNESHYKQ